jgi:hypothetical protein
LPQPPADLPIDTIIEYDQPKFTFFRNKDDFNNPLYKQNIYSKQINDKQTLIKIIFVAKITENNIKYKVLHKNTKDSREIDRKFVNLSNKELTIRGTDLLFSLKPSDSTSLDGLKKDILVKYSIAWKDYIGRISDDYVNFMPNKYIDSANEIDFTYYIVQHKDKKYAVKRSEVTLISSGIVTAAPK